VSLVGEIIDAITDYECCGYRDIVVCMSTYTALEISIEYALYADRSGLPTQVVGKDVRILDDLPPDVFVISARQTFTALGLSREDLVGLE
jgi:hypothetical protein